MNRRTFIRRSSAGIVFAFSGGNWVGMMAKNKTESVDFKPYRSGKTLGDVVRVTPDDGYYVNTYYDICPFSPTQRYLALTRLPYQDRITKLGDVAEVVVVDLEDRTIRSVYRTKCWGYQLGANLHWGASDRYLHTNDVLDGRFAVCVRLDLETGQASAYDGPVYDIDPGNQKVISPRLEYMNNSQYAYSTPSPDPRDLEFERLPDGASASEGLWETDLARGRTSLLLSLEKAVEHLSGTENDAGAAYYFFHAKYSPAHDKIMLVVRYPQFRGMRNGAPRYHRNPSLLTASADGVVIQEVVSRAQWAMGGHHPNWHPDNESIVMNLTPKWLGDDTLRFCRIASDGSAFEVMSSKLTGSGHPSVDRSGRYLLSDCYPFEPMATGDGEVPIRLIDLQTEEERAICTVFTDLGQKYDVARYWGPSKMDAHPVWSRDFKKVCFNGAPNGTRQVFVADLNGVI